MAREKKNCVLADPITFVFSVMLYLYTA